MAENGQGVYAKLADLQAEVGGLETDKTADLGAYSYSYVTEAALGRKWRELASPKGLAWAPPSIIAVERQGNVTKLDIRFRIVDKDTGEAAEADWVAYGVDQAADKALNKAETTAVRTFLSKLLFQGGEADPEQEHQADEKPAADPTEGALKGTVDVRQPVASDAQRAMLRAKIAELRKVAPDDPAVTWWNGLKPSGQKALSPSAASTAIDKVQAKLVALAEPELPADTDGLEVTADAEALAAFEAATGA